MGSWLTTTRTQPSCRTLGRVITRTALVATCLGVTLAPAGALADTFAGVASPQDSRTGADITGTIKNRTGTALQRRLMLYLVDGDAVQQTISTPDGRFSFNVPYDGAVAHAGQRNGAVVNWRIEVINGAARWPHLTSTRWLPDQQRWMRPRPEDNPEVTIVDPSASTPAMAAQAPGDLYRCVPSPKRRRYSVRRTAVGELNLNNDVRGTFHYGVQKREETTFSVEGGASKLRIAGDTTLGKSMNDELGTRMFRRYSRFRASAAVEFYREPVVIDRGPKKGRRCYEVVAPSEVLVSRPMTFRNRPRDEGGSGGSCERFPRTQRTVWPREYEYEKTEGRARTVRKSVSAFGIGYQTQSGYTKNVTTYFKMGKRRLTHYLCGTGGSTSGGGEARPGSWDRIYGGA